MLRTFMLALLSASLLIIVSCGSSQEKKNLAAAKFMLGQSELQSGNNQQAYIRFHEALIEDPRNKEVHHALGYVNMTMGDYGKAEKFLMRAVSLDNKYSEAWNSLCSLYHIYLGRYDKALRACEKALENPLYKTPEKSLYNIARIYYKKGNNQKALSYSSKAIKRFPNWFPAYYIQSLAYNSLGNYNQASVALDTAIGLDPRFQGNKKKAEKYFKENRNKKAFFETTQEADILVDILHY